MSGGGGDAACWFDLDGGPQPPPPGASAAARVRYKRERLAWFRARRAAVEVAARAEAVAASVPDPQVLRIANSPCWADSSHLESAPGVSGSLWFSFTRCRAMYAARSRAVLRGLLT